MNRIRAAGPLRTFESESVDLITRFTTNATGARAVIIDDTIRLLKSAGIWSKLDCFYLLAGAASDHALLNWKSTSFTLTPTGTTTFTADRGYAGNGSNGYLASGFNPTTAPTPNFVQLSCHLGLYCRTATAAETVEIGNDQNFINTRSATDFIRVRLMRASTNGSTANTNGSGHYCSSRSLSASFDHYRNGGNAQNVAAVAQAQTSFEMWIGAGNLAAPSYSTKQIACAHWGSHLTAAEVAAMNDIVTSHLARIGAAV